MFIEQAWHKNTDLVKYLPIPIVFLIIVLLNFVATLVLPISVDDIIKQEIAAKGENRFFIETLAPLVVFLFLLLLWVKFVHKQSIRSLTTARPKIDWGRIFFSFGIWSLVTIALTLAAYYFSPEDYEWNFRPVPFFTMAAIAIVMVPLQTSFEEYLFRGYLMQGIGIASRSRLLPLVVTSLLFGLMHIANPEVGKIGYILLVYYIGTGLFLGIITLMDDGMELALGFHAANNLVTALLITSEWTAFQTPSLFKDHSEPSAGFETILPVVVIFPLLLFIFSKKYKWTRWKDKLTGKVQLNANQMPGTYDQA